MNESPDQRLSHIQTMWTVMRAAHSDRDASGVSALEKLVERYRGAAYTYLLGALRDPEAADELFQEFALRAVRGDFARADPERGRFRDYLRRVLINLVNDYHRARKSRPQPFAPGAPEPAAPVGEDSEPDFMAAWRSELLERTWSALAKEQPTYHAVLMFRLQNPDVHSPQMAEQLSRQMGKPLTADSVRKALQRGQQKIAALLVEEVRCSLGEPTEEELVQELRDLDLLKYCAGVLERQGSSGQSG